MILPGIDHCVKELSLMEGKMEKPPYAGIESIVKKEDAIESAFTNLKRELATAYRAHLAVIETKLKSALAENERLHHERIILSKEIHRRRDQEKKLLEVLGVTNGRPEK